MELHVYIGDVVNIDHLNAKFSFQQLHVINTNTGVVELAYADNA